MTATITLQPAPAATLADDLNRLAREHNDGCDRTAQALALAATSRPGWLHMPGAFAEAWEDFCQMVAIRDLIKPPAVEDWTELCGEDYAADQQGAYEGKAAEVCRALHILTTPGARGWLG